jgi:cell filamentation protein
MDKYSYEYEGDSKYCYPETSVLVNLLNIKDSSFFEAERRYTAISTAEVIKFPVRGRFDLAHLMAIHKAIFSEIFDWAGRLRTVNIAKGNPFCQSAYLVDYATELFDMLKREDFLAGVVAEEFPVRLAYYLSEINVLHPFREGNGRT